MFKCQKYPVSRSACGLWKRAGDGVSALSCLFKHHLSTNVLALHVELFYCRLLFIFCGLNTRSPSYPLCFSKALSIRKVALLEYCIHKFLMWEILSSYFGISVYYENIAASVASSTIRAVGKTQHGSDSLALCPV